MNFNSNLAPDLAASGPSTDSRHALDTVLQALVLSGRELADTAGVSVALFRNGTLTCLASNGLARPLGTVLDTAAGLTSKCLRSHQLQSCPDIELEEGINRDSYRALGIRSLLLVPVLQPNGDLAGIVEATCGEPNGFTEESQHCLKVVAGAIEGVIREDKTIGGMAAAMETSPRQMESSDALLAAASSSVAPRDEAEPAPAVSASYAGQDARFQKEKSTLNAIVHAPSAEEIQTKLAVEPGTNGERMASLNQASTGVTTSTFLSAEAEVEAAANPQPTVSTAPIAPTHEDAWLPAARQSSALPTFLVPGQAAAPLSPSSHHSSTYVLLLVGAGILLLGGLIGYVVKAREPGIRVVSAPAPQPVSSSIAQKPAVAPAPQVNPPEAHLPTPSQTAAPAMVTAIQHTSTPESTTVAIAVDQPVRYQVRRLPGPERIYIDLSNVRLGPHLNGKNVEVGESCLQRYRLGSPGPTIRRITFETGGVCDYSVKYASSPSRLIVALRAAPPGR